MDEEITIYCADIGSVRKNRFGWARLDGGQDHKGNDIVAFVDDIASAVTEGRKVALGFECPLWVPVCKKPQNLTAGRRVDGNRPWSAAAGAAALATGLTEVAWILDKLASRLKRQGTSLPPVYLDWTTFAGADSGLFFWEAFVTGKAKASGSADAASHAADALIACQKFAACLPNPAEKCEPEPRVRSLIGGAILWAGWSADLDLLHMPCMVIRPTAEG